MFSPEASTLSARSSLRNPRRRPRNSDGPQQQQPRRKRSKLGDETFTSVADARTNGNGSVLMNGHTGNGSVESSMVLVEMPVREKKGTVKRALKDDTALYLTKHENYSVKKLPSFPSSLSGGPAPFRASALSSAALALALTPDQALVWDYSSPGGPTKVLALPLPPNLKGSDPLPLGSIVRNGPANDFGVVAVAPSTGKIVFWENVDSAEARSHFPQRHQGVEGLFKLYSGERITEVVDVEHAGYILVCSSGRLAQLTLRDSQGRPSINTTILTAPSSSGGSFFSFKGLLGGAIRKTIASVKARPSDSKGQMEVITATKSGLFHVWDLSWSGQQNFKREMDVHTNVLAAMQQGTAPETRGQQDLHILDFAIMEQQAVQGSISLLALVGLSGRNMLDYFLVELDISEDAGTVSRAIPLRNFHQAELPKEASGTLLLPSPGHTAMILFPSAIVVASLTELEASPEAQLFSDAGTSILPFQDSIYFKDNAHVHVAGHALERSPRRDNLSSALIFVQDYGILQINARDLSDIDDDDDNRHKVTAFSKVLQATYFSTVPGTIFDFSTTSRYSFGQDEVEKAAIDISAAVLSSSSEHFEKVTASMDEQLRKRAFVLRTLNTHLRAEYPPLSFAARWKLLWHAEKVAGAQELWKWFQAKLHDQQLHPEAYPERIIMGDIVKALHEKYKTPLDQSKGETDPIRHFFLNDLDSIGVLIPWGWNFFRVFYMKVDEKDLASTMQRLSEATDVLMTTLEASFSFRQANLERYGLEPDSLRDGILKPAHGYDILPSFWTSSHNIVSSIRSLVDVGRNLANTCYEDGTEPERAQKLGQDNARLVKLECQTHIERFQWALEQSDEKTRETGRKIQEDWDQNVRPAHIYSLMEIGLPVEGMNLAEQYEDMGTLAKITWDEKAWLQLELLKDPSKAEKATIKKKVATIQERIARYFDQYGDRWAEAYFSKHIAENKSGQLLESAPLYEESLTRYLRGNEAYSRLCWINEVISKQDYERAGHKLYQTAKNQEANAWCNKVELSLAKLAMLCKDDGASEMETLKMTKSDNKHRDDAYKNINIRMEYADLHTALYEQRLAPIITTALDDHAAVDELMNQYGQGRLTERPALQSLLRQGFEDLVHHRLLEPCLMIDVLTLMTYEMPEEPVDELQGYEFWYALRTLAYNWDSIQRTTRNGLVGLIWKRLAIKDDWAEINNTRDIPDDVLKNYLVHTATGWTFRQLVSYRNIEGFENVWKPSIDDICGTGCTDGELCIRFPSEDLRQPIMRDNALDDAIFVEHVEKHRLGEWLDAAEAAAEQSLQDEQEGQQQLMTEEQPEDEEGEAVQQTEEVIEESVEVRTEEIYLGEEEGAEDVEMQDS